jgi:Spy/CpxP family protein refolding chaperone
MKPRCMMALIITLALVISAAAQENRTAQPTNGVTARLSGQQSSSTPVTRAQLQVPPGSPDATYPELMQAVLQGLSEDLVQIGQAAHDGKISQAQAEYLNVEAYYVALTRFQLLRALYQSSHEANKTELYSPANTAPQVSGNTIVIPPPTSSPDVSEQIASYLELTPSQVAAIQAQVTDERKRVEPLLEQLDKSRRTLISATLNGSFDAEEVQTLAAEQSRIVEKLIVANALLESKVYSMLTMEQQHKVDELRRRALASLRTTFPDW